MRILLTIGVLLIILCSVSSYALHQEWYASQTAFIACICLLSGLFGLSITIAAILLTLKSLSSINPITHYRSYKVDSFLI